MASKKETKGSNSAEKMADGDIKVADIQTAASSTMGPADYEYGYPARKGSLRNSYGKRK